MFEQASRLKLRFATSKGSVSVEELWDLPLQSTNKDSLDSIAIDLNSKIKQLGEESFVTEKTKSNTTLTLAFDIVKHVIAVRLKENADKALISANKAKKDKILAIIANKQDSALEEKSVEELLAELSAIGG